VLDLINAALVEASRLVSGSDAAPSAANRQPERENH